MCPPTAAAKRQKRASDEIQRLRGEVSSQRDTIVELEKQLSFAKQSATKWQKARDFSNRAKEFDGAIQTKWKDRTRKSKDVRDLTDHFKAICGGSVEKRAPLLSALARKVGVGGIVVCDKAEWKRLQTYKYMVEQRIRPVIQVIGSLQPFPIINAVDRSHTHIPRTNASYL